MTKVAMCVCGSPLIMTFHWRAREFYCIDCGRLYDFFGPEAVEETPELLEKMEQYQEEWRENAGSKLLTFGAFHEGCEKCKGMKEEHMRHASPAELEANKEAVAWIESRRKAKSASSS